MRSTLFAAALLAAGALQAQQAEETPETPQPVPPADRAAAPDFDIDCTDSTAVLAFMGELESLSEMTAVRNFCTEAFVASAADLGSEASAEDAFNLALSKLDLEITTLKLFQRDLQSGGKLDNGLRQTATEIEALEDEIARQRERNPEEAERSAEQLAERKGRFTTLEAQVGTLKTEVDASLRALRDDAPDIALSIRLRGLDETLAQLETVVNATRATMDRMENLEAEFTQETN
ncbi:hypothetical protein [Pseudoponticoccus marisrubri]|uniref:Uncharacterized protein n=1 Tax=Pseudoponticoccus marisrubri TaxID=1685382 RepID=A0A0W7WPD2_9RHOB|nr:hypothetical protein [Pseudoponticoccus marisrubri]KUF12453.1 hypothetical protein AVJ23_01605 [Pseudoponticoccus marisrubri]